MDESLDAYAVAGVVEPADPGGAVLGTFPVSTRATRITGDRARAAGTPAAGTPSP